MKIAEFQGFSGARSPRGAAFLCAEFLLAVLLVGLIAKIIMMLTGIGAGVNGGQALPAKPAAQMGVNGVTQEPDLSVLTSFDPYHRAAVSQQPQPMALQISAPETNLNLKVYGMRADTSGESSSAIIQTPDNKQASYMVGEEIIPGVTLESVDIDFVILNRDGTRERLSRQGRAEGDKDTQSISAAAQELLAFEARDMLNDVRFFPQREGRETIGYRVMERKPGYLSKYGFKQGDIITSINGEDLTQRQVNLPMLFKNLKQARYASIQIIRDDMPTTLEVNLR